MQFPQFSISRYGVVGVQNPQMHRVPETITAYEFEFYTEDYPGGSWVDGEFRGVRKGYYSLCRPGQRQILVPPYRCFFLNILTQDEDLRDFFDHLPDGAEVLDMEAVVTLIREMMATPERHSLAGRLRLESCVGRIIALLADQRLTGDPGDRGTLLHRKMLLTVDRYMREHLEEDLSLKRLAQISNLDPTYFHKLYTAAYGKTPARRLLEYRIAGAKLALIEGELSLSEVASHCGFASQAYFCSKFKQVTGKTPSEYRNEAQYSKSK